MRESLLKQGVPESEELKMQLFYNPELGSSLYEFFCEEMKAGSVSPFFRCPNIEERLIGTLYYYH